MKFLDETGLKYLWSKIKTLTSNLSTVLSDSYAASTLEGEDLAPVAGDTYETAFGKLHKNALD